MSVSRATKEKWRIGVNVTLTQILGPILYGISTSLYLPSFHRFVTNPTTIIIANGTQVDENMAEPGLGLSELFYSVLIGNFFGGEVVGGLIPGFFVNCVPYWYQFMFAISLHIIGYVLYGVATNGWVLLVGMFLAGYYLGAQITLSMTYAVELSVKYVNLKEEKKKDFDHQAKVARTRNYFYSFLAIGFSIGYTAGPCLFHEFVLMENLIFCSAIFQNEKKELCPHGINPLYGTALLFSHLPIEQYRPVAWFNIASGLTLLVLFGFFFRGESSWKRAKSRELCICSKNNSETRPGPLQIFIIVTLILASFVQMWRWDYFEALMNPILSDSFGFTLKKSSYIYVGFAVSSVIGSLLIVVLQKLKMSSQAIAFIGTSGTIIGYLLATDWQTIPYDPCTEYSPFHHPSAFLNNSHTASVKQSPFSNENQAITDFTNLSLPITLSAHLKAVLNFSDNQILEVDFPFLHDDFQCKVTSNCDICKGSTAPCVSLVLTDQGEMMESYLCSHYSSQDICITGVHSENPSEPGVADIQMLMVLSEDVYSVASNACINANVSVGECQWIPFASGEKCEDCPPICRGKQRTLLLPLYLIGMILLLGTFQMVWVSIIAMASNQSPESLQGVVIGSVTAVNSLAESIGPVIVVALYEGAQKREFAPSILFACLNVPILVEIIILYKYLGPNRGIEYSPLKGEDEP